MVFVHRAILYFDGTSQHNPHGPAGCGYNIVEMDAYGADGMTVVEGSLYLGHGYSNNQAGYQGLISGLICLRDNMIVRKLYIRGDSEMMMKQLLGANATRSGYLAPFHGHVMNILSELNVENYRLTQVSPCRNYRSDELANLALNNGCDNIVWYR